MGCRTRPARRQGRHPVHQIESRGDDPRRAHNLTGEPPALLPSDDTTWAATALCALLVFVAVAVVDPRSWSLVASAALLLFAAEGAVCVVFDERPPGWLVRFGVTASTLVLIVGYLAETVR